MQRKSIREIAALAQVSIGTVDRVLHNRGRVAPDTEARVRQVIRDIEYRPNVFASTLKTGKTHRFGVLMPRPGLFGEYWELPLAGIHKAARELAPLNVSVDIHLFDLPAGTTAFREAARSLLEAEPDGLILAPVLTEEFQELLTRLPSGRPYVFFDSFLPQAEPLTVIGQDHHRAGRVAGHLMSLLLPRGGKVVVIRNLPGDCHIDERVGGFVEYLASLGGHIRTVTEEVDLAGEGTRLGDRIDHIRTRHPDLTGLYVTNGNTFPYARLARGPGRRLACVGFDRIGPNLDCLREGSIDFLISQHAEEYGYLSVTTLYRHLVLKEPVPARLDTPIGIVCRENID